MHSVLLSLPLRCVCVFAVRVHLCECIKQNNTKWAVIVISEHIYLYTISYRPNPSPTESNLFPFNWIHYLKLPVLFATMPSPPTTSTMKKDDRMILVVKTAQYSIFVSSVVCVTQFTEEGLPTRDGINAARASTRRFSWNQQRASCTHGIWVLGTIFRNILATKITISNDWMRFASLHVISEFWLCNWYNILSHISHIVCVFE